MFDSTPLPTSVEIVSPKNGTHDTDEGRKLAKLQKRRDYMKTYRPKKGKVKGKDDNAEVVEKGKEDASSALKTKKKTPRKKTKQTRNPFLQRSMLGCSILFLMILMRTMHH